MKIPPTIGHYSILKFLRALGLSLVLVAAAPWSQAAQTNSWTGTGADTLWSTAANWSLSAVPLSTDVVDLGTNFTSGTNITIGGTSAAPTQLSSLNWNLAGGQTNDLISGYLQINTGDITTTTTNSGIAEEIISTTLYIAASGTGVNTWNVGANNTLQILNQIGVVGGGTGAGSTITKQGTGNLSLYASSQTYAGNWDINGNVQTYQAQEFGTGAVSLTNSTWLIGNTGGSTGANMGFSNNLSISGNVFLSTATGTTVTTLTGNLGSATAASQIFFNFDGGNIGSNNTIHLAGSSPSTYATNTQFIALGTVELDTTGQLSGISTVTLSRNGGNGTLNWNVADTVATNTTFVDRLGGIGTLGMIGSGTTTINGNVHLNNSSTTNDGANMQLNAVSGGTLVLAGQVSDSLSTTARSITKIGAGTVILSGTGNNYRGGTYVNVGTLLINSTGGTGSGAVSVASGATLGGTGSITGATTIASGGNLTPGVSGTGLLTISNSLTLSSGSTTTFTMTATNNFSSINLGANALTEGGALVFAINGYTPTTGDAFQLVTFGSQSGLSSGITLTGTQSGTFTDAAGVWSYTNGSTVWQYSDLNGQLSILAVPEPSDVALIALSGLALVIVLRRRRQALA